MFNQSSCHKTMASDALNVAKMTVILATSRASDEGHSVGWPTSRASDEGHSVGWPTSEDVLQH